MIAIALPEVGAGDPYAGLRDLSAQCWAGVGGAITRAKSEHLHTYGGGPGVFDDISLFLDNLLDTLSMSNVTWWFRYNLLDPWARYVDDSLVHSFKTFLSSQIGSIGDTLWLFRTGLNAAIGQVPASIASALGSGAWQLGITLSNLVNQARGTVSGSLYPLTVLTTCFPAWLRDPLMDLGSSVVSGLLSGGSLTGQIASGALGRLGGSIVSGLLGLGGPLGVVGTVVGIALGNQTIGQVQGLKDLGTQIIADLSRTVSQAWTTISHHMVSAVDQALHVRLPWLDQTMNNLPEIPGQFMDYVVTLCGDNLAMQPARALSSIGALYGLSLAAGSTAHLTSTLLNLVPTLNWVGASQFAALVSEVAAFTPITNASYGVLLNEVLAIPLRYHWNQMLRPRLPTEGEIFTMGRKHGISYGEFKNAMAYTGIPDWWIEKMYDFFWTDPSPMWLLRMVEGGVPRITEPGRKRAWLDEWLPDWQRNPLAWLEMKLMLAGYEDCDLGPMIEGMTGRGMQSPVTQFKTSVRAMVRDAYWTEGQAAAALAPYNVRAEEVHLLYIAEELDYQKGYLDDQVMYYKEAFRKGRLSEQDLTLALSTIYVREERIAQEVMREVVRTLPTPKTTIEYKEPAEVKSLRTSAIGSWTKQFRAWEISEADLLLGLTIVVRDAALAAEMVDVEKTRYREPPKEPTPPPEDPVVASARRQAIASWVTEFREGRIKSSELEVYLEPLIPNRDTRRQLVDLEQLRYNPSPELLALAEENAELAKVRAEHVRGHCDMFQKRTIDVEQLYAFLLGDGLDNRLARATCITQASKRIRVPAPDSLIYRDDVIALLAEEGIEGYERAYLAGEITLVTYAAWLQSIVEDPDVATYLADVLSLKRFSTAI